MPLRDRERRDIFIFSRLTKALKGGKYLMITTPLVILY